MALGLLIILVAWGAAESHYRLYRRVWTVAGVDDAIAIGKAVIEASLLVTAANLLIPPAYRPFHAIVPILAVPAVGCTIGFIRLLPRLFSRVPRAANRLLIVVPNHKAYATLKAVLHQPNPVWATVAIVTSVRDNVHDTVMGVPVVGTTEDLGHWIEVTRADGVAFLVDGTEPPGLRGLFAICLAAKLPVFTIPTTGEWLLRPGADRLRKLSADDLVGRKQTEFELEAAGDRVAGATVLITGAAGSIGSELCRLVIGLRPRRIVLVDNDESGLFEISEELKANHDVELREALLTIVDLKAVTEIFADEQPDIVFHAAAYKHVPLLEAHPDAAVRVNVTGTHNLIRAAAAAGTTDFILVSTDKAVARHSVMGCTKRLCELMVLSHSGPMRCWAVRFGNVVGSRGSVVPIFERQIEAGGPVTITHPDMTRYMMTINEAASLVIHSLRLAKPGHLYMLDMGEPISILSLAQTLIRSRGLRPGSDIEIVFTGLRPGERLTEEILGPDEGMRPTSHQSIMEVISPTGIGEDDLNWVIARLGELAEEGHKGELVQALKKSIRVESLKAKEEEVGPIRRSTFEHDPA